MGKIKKDVKKQTILFMGGLLSLCVVISLFGYLKFNSTEDIENNIQTALEELETFEGQYDSQRIVLNNTTKNQAEKLAKELGARVRTTPDGSYAVLYLPEGVDIKSIYENKEYQKYIDQMELDYYGEMSSSTTKNGNNLSFDDAMECVNLNDTWKTTKGEDVTIAVIDTGIDTDNKYLASKISNRSFNATEGKVVADTDISVIEEDSEDISNKSALHGTKVASILSAEYDAKNGIGGIAPNAELLVIKVKPDNDGKVSASDVVFAIAYAIECDADVINMSFAFETNENPFEKYTQLAVDSDVICVAAAGNKASGVSVWPAADKNVIGVGAVEDQTVTNVESGAGYANATFGGYISAETTNPDDRFVLSSNSNYGDNTDIVAVRGIRTTGLNGEITSLRDTSCSSAVVTGAIALYLSENQNQEFSQVKEVLNAAGYDLGTPGLDWYYGCGMIDIHALVVEEKGTITYDYLTDEIDNEKRIFVRGHKLQDVPEPERNYLVFDGWNYDINCQEEWDNFESPLHEDLTVYASWVNEDDTEPYSYYIKDDGTAEILSYLGKRRYVTIPDTLDGYIVTSIGSRAFYQNSRLRKIIFPEKLTKIGEYAFYNCTKLMSIDIPGSVEVIDKYAFCNCPALGDVIFDENGALNTIEEFAFAECGKIRRIDLPAALSNLNATVFFRNSNMIDITVSSKNPVFYSDNSCLYKKDYDGIHCVYFATGRSGEYNMDSNTKVIDEFAFAYSKINFVQLPDDLLEMKDDAFVYSNINTIEIPDNIKEISKECFVECKNLSEVIMGKNIESIGELAFAGCNKLDNIIQTTVSIDTISSAAFAGCSSLEDISFISASTKIGAEAFADCYSIKNIVLPNTLKQLSGKAFAGCSNIEKVIFEDGIDIKILEKRLFNGCTSLKEIVLPEGMTTIQEACFAYTALEKIFIPASVTKIESNVFGENRNLKIIEVAETNNNYTSIDNVLYQYADDKNELVLNTYPAGKEGIFNIPEQVIEISDYAFNAAEKLTVVNFNSGLKKIGNNAFQHCYGLKEVQLPNTVEEIGSSAFYLCIGLENVVLNNKIIKIESNTFLSCISLSNITLGESVVEIGIGAFENCSSLSTIDFPDSLEMIGNGSFRDCYSLQELYITKGIVTIGQNAFYGDYNLENISFDGNCKISRFGYGTFSNSGIREIVVPSSVSSMGQEVFSNTKKLEKIVFAEGSQLSALTAWTFSGADNLKSIIFESDSELKHIQARTFERLSSIETIDLSNCFDLKVIDNYAFEYCSDLNKVVLPEGLEKIGRYAFYGCKKMTELSIPSSVTTIGRYAFAAIPNINIYFNASYLPENLHEHWDFGITGYFVGSGEIHTSGDWSYVLLNDGTISLKEYTGTDTEIILSTIDGYTITSIAANMLNSESTVESLILPDTIVSICSKAFKGAEKLRSINIPESVEYIGEYAFSGSGISEVEFAEESKISVFSTGVFENTNNLKMMNIPDSIESINGYSFNNSSIENICFGEKSELSYVGKYAFANCKITNLVLPDKLNKIDYHAFEGNNLLETVSFGSSDLDLYGYAFYNTGLTSLDLPESIQYIGEYCFAYCDELHSINVSDENKFYSSDNGILFNKELTKLICCPGGKEGNYSIPDCVEVLGCGAFEGSKLSAIKISDNSSINTIGYKAFYDCKNLTAMHIPADVQSIDFYAFAYCTNLINVSIEQTSRMSGIYEGAFYGCQSLENINIPDNVFEIGEYAFYDCESLKSIEISQASEIMGIFEYAFAYTSLEDFEIPENLVEIGSYAFSNAAMVQLEIPNNVKEVGEYAFESNNFESITINSREVVLGSGCFYNCSKVSSMIFETMNMIEAAGLTEMFKTIPSSLLYVEVVNGDYLPENSFVNCNSIVEVKLPDELSEIGKEAFGGCTNLESITSDLSSVEVVGESAFYNCVALSGLESMTNVREFRESCFEKCSNIENISFSNTEYIKEDAFRDCKKITEAIFTSKIKAIDDRAFYQCWKLNKVYIADGGLKNGNIGEAAFFDTPLTELYIGEGVKVLESSAFSWINIGDSESYIEEIILPNSLVSVGNGAFSSADIQKLVIGDGVKEIGDTAFWGCTRLEDVKWGKSIEYIGNSAFENCFLKEIFLPDTIKHIGENAFYIEYADSMEEIFIPDSISSLGSNAFYNANIFFEADQLPENVDGDWAGNENVFIYYGAEKKEWEGLHYYSTNSGVCAINYDGTKEYLDLSDIEGESACMIAMHCFKNNKIIKQCIVGEGMKIVQKAAFIGCTSLESIDLSSVTSMVCLGEQTFKDCTNLQNVILSDAIKRIDEACFMNCTSLMEVELPDEMTIIEADTFYNCSSLKSVDLPNQLEIIGVDAFRNSGLVGKIEIPSDVTSIGWAAFAYCHELTEVVLNNKLEKISGEAFKSCTKIKNIDIPHSVNVIEQGAFEYCSSLESVTLSNSLEKIMGGTFRNCTNLKSIILPESIVLLSGDAFKNCSSLEYIQMNGVKKIGSYTFSNCNNLNNIVIPECAVEFDQNTFKEYRGIVCFVATELPTSLKLGWNSDINSYILGYLDGSFDEQKEFDYYISQAGVQITKYRGDDTELVLNTIDGKAIISIEENAFANNEKIQKITLPETLNYIGKSAFVGCINLTEINIPSQLEKIDEQAFSGCRELQDIEFNESKLKIIGYSAFYDCGKLKNIIFPNTLKEIGQFAFAFTGLQEITFTGNLDCIGNSAFWCYDLQKVNNQGITVKDLMNEAFIQCDEVFEFENGIKYVGSWASLLDFNSMNIDVCELREGTTTVAGTNYDNYNSTTSKLIIPDSVKSIGHNSFSSWVNLQTIEGMECIEYVRDNAFSGCTSLTKFILPNTMKEVGSCILGDTKLEELSVPFIGRTTDEVSNLSYLFSPVTWGYESVPENLKTLHLTGNANETGSILNTKLTVVNIAGNYKKISDNAFYYCSELSSVNIKHPIESIGNNAFDNCTSLTEIKLPYGVKEIGEQAFSGCTNINQIIVPNTAEAIGYEAFANCSSLTEVIIPNSVETMGDSVFNRSYNLEKLTVPFVGRNVNEMFTLSKFFNNDPYDYNQSDYKLKELIITGNITTCPDVSGFRYLEKLTIPDTVTTINGKFSGTKISEFKLPSHLKVIGNAAFAGSNITNLILPVGVETIGRGAFGGMKLGVIYIPSTVLETGEDLFNGSTIKELYIDNDHVDMGKIFKSRNVNVKCISIPYLGISKKEPCRFVDLVGINCNAIDKVILQDTCELVMQGAFEGIEDAVIYCYEDSSSSAWPENWNNDNFVYYKDKWRGINYFVDNKFIYSSFQGMGDPIKMPAKKMCKKNDTDTYTYTFLGWDITEDNNVDNLLSTTASNSINAKAVYSIVSKEQYVSVDADVEGYTEQSLVLNAISDSEKAKKVKISMTNEDIALADGYHIIVNTDFAKVEFDKAAISNIADIDGENVSLGIEKIDQDLLASTKADDVIYDLSLVSTDADVIFGDENGDLDSGSVTVTIPYEIGNVDTCEVYYVDELGKETKVNAAYSEINKTVSFKTSHFSLYKITKKEAETISTLIFDVNGGDSIENCIRETGRTIELPVCTRYGYIFEKWIDSEGNEYSAGDRFVLEKDITLTAQWKEQKDIILLADKVMLTYDSMIYDGFEKEPEVIIPGLEYGIDYKVSYVNNKNVGIAKIIITGFGNYGGVIEKEFSILPINIKSYENKISLSQSSYEYTGQQNEPTIEIDGLQIGEDYAVRYENNINCGDAQIVITGLGNYSGEIVKTFIIVPQDISSATIEVGNIEYTGEERSPNVKLTDKNGRILLENTDYEMEFTDNVDVGIANVKVIAKGNYQGEILGQFNITPANIGAFKITMISDSEIIYTGEAIEPGIVIKKLEEGKDYKLTYQNNINAGEAEILVEGLGNYIGKQKVTFDIKPRNVKDFIITDKTTYSYTGEEIFAELNVESDLKKILIEEEDYTIREYRNNVNVGIATVVIEGMGNYTGVIEHTYEICASDIQTFSILLEKKEYSYSGLPIEPEVIVQNNEGEILKANEEYIVNYHDNLDSGTAKIEVMGMGNYSGSIYDYFEILPLNIEEIDNVLEFSQIEYSGMAHEPIITLETENGAELQIDKDYIVRYENNINAGDARIILNGIGNYSGEVSLTFKITRKSLGEFHAYLKDDVEYRYTGNAFTPEVIVEHTDGTVLRNGIDYTVDYLNNIEVGNAQIYISGTGNYKGSISLEFEILSHVHRWNNGIQIVKPSCNIKGEIEYTCLDCSNTKIETQKALNHSYKQITTKATTKANGKIETKCSRCNYVSKKTDIYRPAKVVLSAAAYTYNGKTKTPTVKVTDAAGKTISASNYTVKYASGRKNVGKYAVTVTFKGNYSGTLSQSFVINPKSTSISKLSKAKKAFTVKWKKQSKQVTGYQIQYSTNKKFTNAKTVTIKKYKTTSKKITKLSKKKTYYVRVRTYKTVGKTKFYSGWSKVKSVKTK